MSDNYILEGHKAIPCTDLLEWAKQFGSIDRHVADETIEGIRISTVFLGLNHSFGCGPPLLFETMVFGGILDNEMDRYTTWEQAEEGHKQMVQKVKDSLNKVGVDE
jgi:hypothetical protein